MSEVKVNSIKGVGASVPAISINNTDGTCTANITNKPNRNLIINGAMNVAQRGTSSTSYGIHTVDRIACNFGGTDEVITQSQVDVAAGTTPYTLGFRKAFRLTNGNQTSGAGASDFVRTEYRIEAQDIANSGWNYTSSSSNITLSFWVKSSVSKNFNYLIHSSDGTARLFPTETGTLSADTWTKVTKTISGDSNLTFDNDNGLGMILHIYQYLGTTYTASSVTNNQWVNYNGNEQTPDQTSTWWTTNDATFEITGLQLEVGSVATDFEHRSFAQELQLCKRYYEVFNPTLYVLARYSAGSGGAYNWHTFEVEKRDVPTSSFSGTFTDASGYAGDPNFTNADTRGIAINSTNAVAANGILYLDDSGSAFCKFDAEL